MEFADLSLDRAAMTAFEIESRSTSALYPHKFFEDLTAGREGNDLMLPRPDGDPWARTQQQRPMREACKRAGITPAANFHSLRHTYASLLVMADVPLVVVAENLGHADTRMCEKHYAHLSDTYRAESIRSKAPKLGIVKRGKVVRLGASRA